LSGFMTLTSRKAITLLPPAGSTVISLFSLHARPITTWSAGPLIDVR
jgi:hypothetical protein